ncbi:hypothetical protein [Paenibacillus sp. EKM211P]|uniref:hypothetical protein n=1 Tax=unclassified Paenibacillus TaxID=185978 RepID=UPI000F9F193B|nr:hypothetical protein [Paenibacillus sp. EKM211P]KAF6583121.1 hypothetical protein G9G57_14765 [Paenibacillus sp. EKM211P]
MYEVYLYERSIQTSHLSNNVSLKLEFDLNFYEDTIRFSRIKLSDQQNRIQNVLDVQVCAKVNNIKIKKTIGQIQCSLLTFNYYSNSTEWEWVFDSKDISNIEEIRSGDASFSIEIKIIILTKNENKIIPFNGSGQISFPEEKWLSFIRHFGYSTKYGLTLPPSLLNDKSWLQAFDKLKVARDHMQRGITHDALRQCLSTLEAYSDAKDRGGPYDNKSWEGFLKDFVPQKKAALAGLFSGIATYLNKVGHHRESKQLEDGLKTTIPLDQYEVELLLAISHLTVTYLERIRIGNTQGEIGAKNLHV